MASLIVKLAERGIRELHGLYLEYRLRMHIFVYFSRSFAELLSSVDVEYLIQFSYDVFSLVCIDKWLCS
jgi:hypothetical protein